MKFTGDLHRQASMIDDAGVRASLSDPTPTRDTAVVVARFVVLLTLWPWAMFYVASLFFGDSPEARVDVLVRLHWWTFLYPFAVGLGILLSIGLRRSRCRIRLLALLTLPAFILLMLLMLSIELFR